MSPLELMPNLPNARFLSALGVVIGGLALSPLARADRVVLSSGEVIEGKAARRAGKVVVEVEAGTIALPEDSVSRIEKSESIVSRVDARRSALSPKDVKGRLLLADYCRDHDMRARERQLLLEVIDLDRDNEAARLRLGFVKTPSGWLTRSDAARAQGLVERSGRFVTTSEARDADLREETEATARYREQAERELAEREARLAAERAQAEAERESERNRAEAETFHNDYWYSPFYAPGFAYGPRLRCYGVSHGVSRRNGFYGWFHRGGPSTDLSVVKVPYRRW